MSASLYYCSVHTVLQYTGINGHYIVPDTLYIHTITTILQRYCICHILVDSTTPDIFIAHSDNDHSNYEMIRNKLIPAPAS